MTIVESRPEPRTRFRPVTWLLVVVLCIPVLVAGRIVQVAGRDDRPPVDAIVVLGAAASNGHPGQVLTARLDHARLLYAQGVAPVIVTAGGTGTGQPLSEAEAGAAWLVGQGVAAEAIVAVASGRDTRSSLAAVADQAAAAGWTSVLLVSDPWHMYRSRAMAEDAGLPVVATSPTSTGPNVTSGRRIGFNIVRETAAFITYRFSTIQQAVT